MRRKRRKVLRVRAARQSLGEKVGDVQRGVDLDDIDGLGLYPVADEVEPGINVL